MEAIELIQPEQTAITHDQAGSLANHPVMAYLAGLGNASRRPQRQALDVIAAILTGGRVSDSLAIDWAAVRYSHTQAVRSKLAEHYAASSANRMLTALRGTLRAAWRLGLMSAEDYQAAADVKAVTGETIPAGRELSAGELSALLADCQKDDSPSGIKDGAMIALMYACGLRRAEVIGLDLANYDHETGRLVILGKRNKQRTAYVTNGARHALEDWLELRGNEAGPLFCEIGKAGAILLTEQILIVKPGKDGKPKKRTGQTLHKGGRMTSQAVYNMLKRRGSAAGVSEFSPHDLRRTFVSDLLEAGADIATVAKMAGHSNVQTTARYDRRPEQAKEKAAGLLHVPYTRQRKQAELWTP